MGGGEGEDSLKVKRVCKREIGVRAILWEAVKKKMRKTGEIEEMGENGEGSKEKCGIKEK